MRLYLALRLEAQPWLSVVLLTPVVGAISVALVAFVLTIVAPTGPVRSIDAQVVGFHLRETDEGSYPLARVRLPSGRQVTVPIARGEPCAVGDRLRVREIPVRWGRRYASAPEGCSR